MGYLYLFLLNHGVSDFHVVLNYSVTSMIYLLYLFWRVRVKNMPHLGTNQFPALSVASSSDILASNFISGTATVRPTQRLVRSNGDLRRARLLLYRQEHRGKNERPIKISQLLKRTIAKENPTHTSCRSDFGSTQTSASVTVSRCFIASYKQASNSVITGEPHVLTRTLTETPPATPTQEHK